MTQRETAEKQITEFSEKYPDVDIDDIPTSVWESVKTGKDLTNAYEDFRKNEEELYKSAEIINEENAAMSSGRLNGEPKRAIFTAKEVALMTDSQIKENYDDILYSMQSKGFYA